jgi:hypothetical protein
MESRPTASFENRVMRQKQLLSFVVNGSYRHRYTLRG